MREILFRAKNKNGEWVEGFPYITSPESYMMTGLLEKGTPGKITELDFARYSIWNDTICQYTGLQDKNGTKIFEGDIYKAYGTNGIIKHGRYFDEEFEDDGYGWYVEIGKSQYGFDGKEDEYIEVIGNIYDNPELLKGGTK